MFRLFNEAAELRHAGDLRPAAAPPRRSRGGWRIGARGLRRAWSTRCASSTRPDECEALRLRAAQRGLQLPAETLEYLLKRMPRDLRSLLGILDELDEASLVAQRRLTIPFIRDALEKHAETTP